MRGVFRGSVYCGNDEQAIEHITNKCKQNLLQVSQHLESVLKPDSWSVSNHFGVADAYLFIMYIWSRDPRMGDMPASPNWEALAKRAFKLDATQQAMDLETAARPNVDISFLY